MKEKNSSSNLDMDKNLNTEENVDLDMEEILYLDMEGKFQEWFRDPVPVDTPFPVEADRLKYKARRRRSDKLQKLLELLGFGIAGAVSLGAFVGIIILVLNVTVIEWYINDGATQFVVISVAVATGFLGGLYIGIKALYKPYRSNFYKDEYG